MGTTTPFPPSTQPYHQPYPQLGFDGYNSSSASDYGSALLPSQPGYTDALAYPEMPLLGMGQNVMQLPQSNFTLGYGATAGNNFAAEQRTIQHQTVAPADMLLNKEESHYGLPEQVMAQFAQMPEVPAHGTAPQVGQADEEPAGEFEFDQPSFEEVMAVLDKPFVEQADEEPAGEFEFDQSSFEEVMAVLDNHPFNEQNTDGWTWGPSDYV
ncbi:hypothetical protein IMZ48_08765 [Candidatus Bathyarchaeota archaeon]|nr:hypothetical protein [Candidatus Bathyarchaeota archaeon]